MLKLTLYETVQSLYEYHISGETETVTDFSDGNIGSLVVMSVVIKLPLHSINSIYVDEK